MKKFIAVVLIILGFAGASHIQTQKRNFVGEPATTNQATVSSPTVPSEVETAQPVAADSASSTRQSPTSNDADNSGSNLSNDSTYTNIDGNTVHSPAYSTDGSIPEGATAKCKDGTYSFSQHHSGTCSGHQGVSEWL